MQESGTGRPNVSRERGIGNHAHWCHNYFIICKNQIDLISQVFNASIDIYLRNYLFFFIAGTLIGLGLIYFLRRSENKSTYRATIIGFIVGIPFAVFGMLLGGLAGPFGVIFLGMSPGVFTTVVGYFLGRTFSKK